MIIYFTCLSSMRFHLCIVCARINAGQIRQRNCPVFVVGKVPKISFETFFHRPPIPTLRIQDTATPSNNQQSRRSTALPLNGSRDIPNPSPNHSLITTTRPFDNRPRNISTPSHPSQLPHELLNPMQRHQKHHRPRLNVPWQQRQRTLPSRPSTNHNLIRHAPMRHRDPRESRRPQRTGQPRHHRHGKPPLPKEHALLASPAKNVRIALYQTLHTGTLT